MFAAESSFRLLSDPFQIDHRDALPSSFVWLGITAPSCAESENPPANAGTAGATRLLAVRLNSRMLWRAATMLARSFAANTCPPLLSAMHFRRGSFGLVFIAITYTGTPVRRIDGSAAFAAARAPAGFSGSTTAPRSPEGPLPVGPPTHGFEKHSSSPSVRKTTMKLRQLTAGASDCGNTLLTK